MAKESGQVQSLLAPKGGLSRCADASRREQECTNGAMSDEDARRYNERLLRWLDSGKVGPSIAGV